MASVSVAVIALPAVLIVSPLPSKFRKVARSWTKLERALELDAAVADLDVDVGLLPALRAEGEAVERDHDEVRRAVAEQVQLEVADLPGDRGVSTPPGPRDR